MTGDRGASARGTGARGGGWSGGRGRGGDRGRGAPRGAGGYRGGGGARGGYGGGNRDVSSGVSSLNLGEEPSPIPFIRPKDGEQAGYKAAARPAPASRQGKKTFEVYLNVWEFYCEDKLAYSFDVSVSLEAIGNDGSTRSICVNKGPKDDASTYERNELIRAAIDTGLGLRGILSNTGYFLSDGASLMFTNESLTAPLKEHNNKITVPVEKLFARFPSVHKLIRNANVKNIVIEITECKTFNVKDLSGMINIDRDQIDQTAKQFYELLSSDLALTTHTYQSFSGGKLFRTRPERGNKFESDGFGQERRPGMHKAFTLGSSSDGVFGALNIDPTTGTFWQEGKLERTIMEINGWKNARDVQWNAQAVVRTREMIKGLRVAYRKEPNGNTLFDFQISSITASCSRTTGGRTSVKVTTIEQMTCKNAEGQEEPLYNKFSNVNLRLRDWPLIETRRSRRRTDDPTKFDVSTEYFLVELLDVKPHQRVPLRKQGGEQVRAMRVDDRWRRTNYDLEALNLFGDTRAPAVNPALKAFGIHIVRKPLTTTAFTRTLPTVTFNQQRSTQKTNATMNEKTTFYTNRLDYTNPANITTLIVAFSTDPNPLFKLGEQQFAKVLVDAAKAKGMRIGHCAWEIVDAHKLFNRLTKISELRKAKDSKLQNVVFMYVEPEAKKSHDELKLFERLTCTVTQHLTMESARELLTNRPMMENVLMKLNVKGGGHNYIVKPEKFAADLWMGKTTMIMGYDVWHPQGQTRQDKMADRLPDPSVVGFSFNGGVSADSFIGDYHYQETNKERVNDDVLIARIKWMLAVFEKSKGELPKQIIVVRDGISDGQYRHGMDELEALRTGAREYAVSPARKDATGKPPVPDYSPDFIFVISTKRHHKRMCMVTGRGHANMPAMSVVDDTITNPALFEFFLQSHTPLQGTAKVTKYTVLKNDVGANMEAMEALMGALCFEHQVSNNAISIPEPVYQSDEWAKRGAANMKTYKLMYGDNGQFKRDFTYDKLTAALSYWNSDLERVRVNA